jgi:hypothetical protein
MPRTTSMVAIEFFVYKYADHDDQCRFTMPNKVNSQGEIVSYRQCKNHGGIEIDGYRFCKAHARVINAKLYGKK